MNRLQVETFVLFYIGSLYMTYVNTTRYELPALPVLVKFEATVSDHGCLKLKGTRF